MSRRASAFSDLIGSVDVGGGGSSPRSRTGSEGEWESRTDPETGRVYEYNAGRRSSRWMPSSSSRDAAADLAASLAGMGLGPVGEEGSSSSSSGSGSDSDDAEAAAPRAALEAARRRASAALVLDDWAENHSERGQYYWSPSRRELTWSAPERGARNVWFPELASLVEASPATALARAMGTWDPEKCVRFAKEWSPTKVAQVMEEWEDGMLCRVFRHAALPIESKVECCRCWPLERIAMLLRFCDGAVVWEIIGVLYEEEAVWDAEQVATLLEGDGSSAEIARAAQIVANFSPDDAVPIVFNWGAHFQGKALATLPAHAAALSAFSARGGDGEEDG